MHEICDYVWVVVADEKGNDDESIKRVLQRSKHLTREHAEMRLKAQNSNYFLTKFADTVIINGNKISGLHAKVQELYSKLEV
jgi:dephospho-CoA kinase